MDDANVPSLLAMSYLGYEPESQEVADNTRKLILSEANPFYYAGTKLSVSEARTHRSATYGTSPKPSRD